MKLIVVTLFGPLNQLQPRVGPYLTKDEIAQLQLKHSIAQRCPLKVADSDADGLEHLSIRPYLLNLLNRSFRSGRRQTAGGYNSCSKGKVKSQQASSYHRTYRTRDSTQYLSMTFST